MSDEKYITKQDLHEELGKFTEEVLFPAMEAMIDEKLEAKLEEKLEEKFEQKFEEKFQKYERRMEVKLDEKFDERMHGLATKEDLNKLSTKEDQIISLLQNVHAELAASNGARVRQQDEIFTLKNTTKSHTEKIEKHEVRIKKLELQSV